MADSELQGLPPFVSPLDPTDLFFVNQDNATTPESRAMTAQELADELVAEFGIGSGGGGGGGLIYTPTTVTTGNVTAANGNLYACTVAGLTADRDFNLPTPAAAGERVGVFILDGDDTYELIIKANSTEITRLFIQREYLTLISTGTGAGDWKIEVDGRIPCIAILERQAAQSINTASATKIALDTVNTNRGDMGDIATNDRINIRRTNTYVVTGFVSIGAVLDDQEFLEAELYLNGSIHKFKRDYVSRATGDTFASPEAVSRRTFSAGDYLELYLFHIEGASQNTDTSYYPTLAAIEVL